MEEIIVGVVGVLQFDVLKYRLENEYNVEIRLEKLPYEYIRWIANKEEINLDRIQGTSDMKKVMDLKRKSAASLCQSVECRHGTGSKQRPCADRIQQKLRTKERDAA